MYVPPKRMSRRILVAQGVGKPVAENALEGLLAPFADPERLLDARQLLAGQSPPQRRRLPLKTLLSPLFRRHFDMMTHPFAMPARIPPGVKPVA